MGKGIVVCYHTLSDFNDYFGRRMKSRDSFLKDLEYLLKRYEPVMTKDFIDYKIGAMARQFKKPPLLITFDDGHAVVWDELDRLAAISHRFIVTPYQGESRHEIEEGVVILGLYRSGALQRIDRLLPTALAAEHETDARECPRVVWATVSGGAEFA